jgi:hypothetical protein
MFDWLISLPIFLQGTIIIASILVIFGLMYILIKTSISVDLKNGKFNIFSKSINSKIDFDPIIDFIYDAVKNIVKFAINNSTERQMKVVQRKLTLIETEFNSSYYALLKVQGVKHAKLSLNEDNKYFIAIVKNMLYSDDEDGPKSTKSILRSYVVSEDYLEKKENEVDSYIYEVYKIILNSWNSILRDEYDSEIITSDGKTRERIVSNEMIHDDLKEKKNIFLKILTELFSEIKGLKQDTSLTEMQMKIEMKQKINNIYSGGRD